MALSGTLRISDDRQLSMINKHLNLCGYEEEFRSFGIIGGTPQWAGVFSSWCVCNKMLAVAGAWDNEKGRRVSLVFPRTCEERSLPELPSARWDLGMASNGKWLFVTGGEGYQTADGKGEGVLASTLRLNTEDDGKDGWTEMAPLEHPVRKPLAVCDEEKLFIIGGKDVGKCCHLQIYDHPKSPCRVGTPTPMPCVSHSCGAVMHRGDLVVFTDRWCMVYNTHTDRWQHQDHGIHDVYNINAVVHDDMILLFVEDRAQHMATYTYDRATHMHAQLEVDMSGGFMVYAFFLNQL